MSDQVPGYLFENCFRDRSITVFVAPPHRGKTLLMLDMAICLDMELPLFDRFAPLEGKQVLFLGCDAPSWDYGMQARKLCIGHGIPPTNRELLEINGVWRRGFKITDREVQEWLRQWRDLTGTSVLFIDTHRATHRANENDSGEMERVWDIICTMRDKGWAIIMAHHTSKPTEVVKDDVHSARGSSVIGASADFIYTLNKRSRSDNRVQVECVKGRGASEDSDPFTFFDIVPVESDEMVNGRPLYGLKLIASSEDSHKVLLSALATGSKDRRTLCQIVKDECPAITNDMSETVVYRYIDNRLQELRRLGKIKIIERGVWGLA